MNPVNKKLAQNPVPQKPIFKKEPVIEGSFAIPKENYLYLIIGFGIIILGFILMAGGKTTDPNVFKGEELFSFRRVTLAPVVVVIGFIFEIWAIMRKPKAQQAEM